VSAELRLTLTVCRARFRAADGVCFPPEASNALRGVLGHALDASVFSPVRATGPSGLRNPPRPFVLHAGHLNGRLIARGEEFEIVLSVFYVDPLQFRPALERLSAWSYGAAPLERFETRTIDLDLSPRMAAPGMIRVRFETPTELKGHSGGGPPEFKVLMARLRDRIGSLRAIYGPGPLALDFQRFLDAAAGVRLLGGSVSEHSGARRSSRTGQTHPLGGFTGFADYTGDFRSYMPFLEAAAYVCVGRQTVWGHGRLAVEELTS
jgi:hypothetical protein